MTTYYPDDTEIEAYLSSVWTDISSYVIGDIICEGYGILTDSDTDRTAGVGTMTLTLNNTAFTFNPEGSGTPLAGFSKGTYVRVRVTFEGVPKVVFIGRVDRFQQSELPHGPRTIEITIADWFDDAGLYPLKSVAVLDDKRIEEGVQAILDVMAIQPTATAFSVGAYTFDRIFDNISINTRAVSEFDKLALSEMSYIYLRADGTLVVESRNDRTGLTELSAIPKAQDDCRFLVTEDGRFIIAEDGRFIVTEDTQTPEITALIDANPFYGDDLLNSIVLRAFTKTIDTSSFVKLVEKTQPTWSMYLPAGKERIFTFRYSDPANRNNYINGYNLQTPVAGTDYEAFENADGTGTEYTNDLNFVAIYYADKVTYAVTANTANCYLTYLQARGYGIFIYVPDEEVIEDATSIAAYGTRETVLDQKYQLSLIPGSAEAASIVALHKDPSPKLKTVHFNASVSTQNMLAFLYYRIGDLVHISNTETGIDLYHFITNIRFRITPGGVIDYWWGLKEHYSLKKGLSPLAVKFSGFPDSENDLAFTASPFIDDLDQATISVWMYWNDLEWDTHLFNKCLLDGSGDVVSGWYLFVEAAGNINFYLGGVSDTTRWRTTSAVLSGAEEGWHLVTVLLDKSLVSATVYLDGVWKNWTASGVGGPASDSDTGLPLRFGTISVNGDFPTYWNGLLKDGRLYNLILTADEIAGLFANENDYDYLTDGLVFQGFAVKTSKLDDYIPGPIEENMKIRDNIYGLAGTAGYNSSSTDNEIRGADPALTNY